MVKELLKNLNFPEKEARIYLALLELDSAIPAGVAKKTGLNRTTVYDLLESLVQKGLVSKYKKGAKTFFHALDPKQLLTYLDRERDEQTKTIDRQKQRVEKLLPQLISLQNPMSARPRVQFFEGEKGMREAYEDTLTSRSEILAYTNIQTMLETLPNFFPEYFKRRAKAKIPIRAVFVDNTDSRERAKFDREELRETRFLPDASLTWSPETKIYSNKIVIASWKEQMAVMIESKEFVDQQRIIFELLWRALPNEKSRG